jgi:hypothetical protein
MMTVGIALYMLMVVSHVKFPLYLHNSLWDLWIELLWPYGNHTFLWVFAATDRSARLCPI